MEVVHEKEVEQKSDGKVECSNSGLEAGAGWLVCMCDMWWCGAPPID